MNIDQSIFIFDWIEEIRIIDIDGTDEKILLSIPNSKGSIGQIKWSPDGTGIAFEWSPVQSIVEVESWKSFNYKGKNIYLLKID